MFRGIQNVPQQCAVGNIRKLMTVSFRWCLNRDRIELNLMNSWVHQKKRKLLRFFTHEAQKYVPFTVLSLIYIENKNPGVDFIVKTSKFNFSGNQVLIAFDSFINLFFIVKQIVVKYVRVQKLYKTIFM